MRLIVKLLMTRTIATIEIFIILLSNIHETADKNITAIKNSNKLLNFETNHNGIAKTLAK